MLNFNIGNFEIKYREVKYREEGVIIKIEGLNIGVVITFCFKVCVYFFSNFIFGKDKDEVFILVLFKLFSR